MRSLILAAACLIPLVGHTQEGLEDPTPDTPITEDDAYEAVAWVEAEVNLWHEPGDPDGGEAGDWKLAIQGHRLWWISIYVELSLWDEDVDGDGVIDIRHPNYEEIMWCLVFANDYLNFCDKWLWTLINSAEVRNEQARGYVDSAISCLADDNWQGAYDYAEDAAEKLHLRSVQIGRAERDFDLATGWLQDAEDLLLFEDE